MEDEWLAFDQSSQELQAKLSCPISTSRVLSLLQSLGGTSMPPWSQTLRFCWFSKAISLFCHENGTEEWSALHQHSHFLEKPSGPISAAAQLSLPQPLGGALLPPWSLTAMFCWFSKKSVFFCLTQLARRSGWHSTNAHISWRTEWSHLCISSVEIAGTTGRSIVASLVIIDGILLVFKSHFSFLS